VQGGIGGGGGGGDACTLCDYRGGGGDACTLCDYRGGGGDACTLCDYRGQVKTSTAKGVQITYTGEQGRPYKQVKHTSCCSTRCTCDVCYESCCYTDGMLRAR